MVTLQEVEERLSEVENQTVEGEVVSWLDGDCEVAISISYYVPGEIPSQEKG